MKSTLAATCRALLVSLSLVVVPCTAAPAPAPVTTESLLPDFVDLRALAEFPSPAYTTRQFSSYNRASTTPDDPENWFANKDTSYFLRDEAHDGRTEHVLMDAAGPGAVTRIWSADPNGTLRIYLDGQSTPTLEAPFADLLSGKYPGLPAPLSAVTARGCTLYFPIAYASSCKITCDAPKFYYHVDTRTYPAGTPVTTFAPSDLQRLAPKIDALANQLSTPSTAATPTDQPQTQPFDLTIPPGQTATLADLNGSKAITDLTLNPAAVGGDHPNLRNVILRITFDHHRTVETPLADFFAAGPNLHPFSTLPLGITDSGVLYSHWFMPFRQSAKLEVQNLNPTPIPLAGHVALVPHAWTDRSMHFHATYRSGYDLPTRPYSDRTFLDTTGQGVFAGLALTVDNPVRRWWGEGDEKVYVDGESFPSWFGTGTEDYFGYAWCSPQLFTHAYHAQPQCDGPGNFGRTAVNRFHIPDRIPFTRSLRFDMELWHHLNCKVNLATVAYWYALPSDSEPAPPALTAADLADRPVPPAVVHHVPGAIEGESMKVLAHTAQATVQHHPDDSNDAHLWWHKTPKPGDVLRLSFPAPAAGRYHVIGHFLKAPDYGQVQLAINDTPAGEPIDFYYHARALGTDEITLGTFDLHQGANELSVTVTGRNPKAKPGYMFGLDYLLLKPAPKP